MEAEKNEIQKTSGCRKPLNACAVIFVIVFLLFLAGMIWMLRMPSVEDIMKCRSNMSTIGEALERYNDVNDRYPDDLYALKKEYLKSSSVLRCPLDHSQGDKPSYKYFKPVANSKDDFIILECDRHRLKKDMPLSKLMLRKDGNFYITSPSFREVMRESEKSNKSK